MTDSRRKWYIEARPWCMTIQRSGGTVELCSAVVGDDPAPTARLRRIVLSAR